MSKDRLLVVSPEGIEGAYLSALDVAKGLYLEGFRVEVHDLRDTVDTDSLTSSIRPAGVIVSNELPWERNYGGDDHHQIPNYVSRKGAWTFNDARHAGVGLLAVSHRLPEAPLHRVGKLSTLGVVGLAGDYSSVAKELRRKRP